MSTPAQVELSIELTEAGATQQHDRWLKALEDQPAADPFRALRTNRSLEREICESSGYRDLVAWLKDAKRHADSLRRTTAIADTHAQLLRLAWERLERQISNALRTAQSPCALPLEGGVLAFVDGLELCLVVAYEFVGQSPDLEVIEVIENPRSAFDIAEDLLHRDHPTRTELKRMLQSSHRLIWHRDVLAHVDRHSEPSVFGPTIDTLYLAELLAQQLFVDKAAPLPVRVLEVGTGSGFLSAGLLRHLASLRHLLCLEPNFEAMACTNRNLNINTDGNASIRARAALLVSSFDVDLLASQFDLIVCNPPYIPDLPSSLIDRSQYRTGAVAGLHVIDSLLASALACLAPHGRVLLLTSSVTPPEYVEQRLPSGLVVEERPWGTTGKEVLFELEEVFRRPGYLRHLENEGGLRDTGVNYVHQLHAFWLMRAADG